LLFRMPDAGFMRFEEPH